MSFLNSNIDGDDIPQNNVLKTLKNKEIYCVNLDVDTHLSNEYTQDLTQLSSWKCEECTRRKKM